MDELSGKVAIVTGGASGMGRATVELFAREGAQVVCADIKDEAGEDLAGVLGASVAYCRADVSRADEVEALVGFAVKRFGRLDIMFNNAGALLNPAPVDLLDDDFSTTEREFAVNILGPMYGVKYAGRVMAGQGSGSIISTASSTAKFGGLNLFSYRISKAAVLSITQNAAIALGPKGIRVNAISPGPIATPMIANALGLPPAQAEVVTEAIFTKLTEQQALKRIGRPEDIAQAALFLASDRSAYITGVDLAVGGGEGLGDMVDRSVETGQVIAAALARFS